MKLKQLGFEKKIQRLFQPGKPREPAMKESPLLQEHNLSRDNHVLTSMEAWRLGERLFRDAFIKGRQASGITFV